MCIFINSVYFLGENYKIKKKGVLCSFNRYFCWKYNILVYCFFDVDRNVYLVLWERKINWVNFFIFDME